MSPVWIMKAGFCGSVSALTLAMASSSVPSAFALGGRWKPIWLSLICRKVSPRASAAAASPMMPSEWGTPPDTVHNTPVPTQVMHSSTLRRLTPSSRSDSLIAFLLCSADGHGTTMVLAAFAASEDVIGERRGLFPARTKIYGRWDRARCYILAANELRRTRQQRGIHAELDSLIG